MPHLSQFDRERLTQILRKQQSVVARHQALACSLTEKAIRHRTRPDGPWKVILPGVYVVGQGRLTDRQRAVAAFLYARRAIAITGAAALAWHGIPVERCQFIDVLVPSGCRRRDTGLARLQRTQVEPRMLHGDGIVSYVDPERAVIDAVRRLDDIGSVRAVAAAAVQRGKAQIWNLVRDLDSGPVQGSARLRLALAEVADGVRSVAEADLRIVIIQARLPVPLYNPRLFIGSQFLAMPDVWWPDYGVVAEVDSRTWHLSPDDWARTLERHDRMTAAGILVLHFPPARLRTAKHDVIRELRAALASSRGSLPQVTTLPQA